MGEVIVEDEDEDVDEEEDDESDVSRERINDDRFEKFTSGKKKPYQKHYNGPKKHYK